MIVRIFKYKKTTSIDTTEMAISFIKHSFDVNCKFITVNSHCAYSRWMFRQSLASLIIAGPVADELVVHRLFMSVGWNSHARHGRQFERVVDPAC